MRVKLVALLSLTLGLAPATPAWAGCLQSELRGVWRLYAVGASAQGLYTLRCNVRVARDNTGTITGTCTDDSGESGAVTGGRLRVNSSCTVTGSVTVAGTPLLAIEEGTLDLGKQNMAGVGEDHTGGIFQFSGVKR
jgi:hypothetical protein